LLKRIDDTHVDYTEIINGDGTRGT
jgi:hypothetical protein